MKVDPPVLAVTNPAVHSIAQSGSAGWSARAASSDKSGRETEAWLVGYVTKDHSKCINAAHNSPASVFNKIGQLVERKRVCNRAGGLRFKSRAGQIGQNVTNGSPPLRHFFESS